ncbi:hypothetical protein CRYUN_Cryun16bG0046700 [Craigia yunnanensis]
MPYSKAMILEKLKRHPPGYFVLPHYVTEDTVLVGFLIPKNGTINIMVADIGWDPKVSEDLMPLKLERFLRSDDSSRNIFDITESREIKMMPFGVKRRICPRLGLALLYLEYFVANLIWKFEWKAMVGDKISLEEKREITVVMKTPLRVHMLPRKREGLDLNYICTVFMEKLKLHNMTERRYTDTSSRALKSASSTELEVHVGSLPFTQDKELLASKSAKVDALLKDNSLGDLSYLLRDIPADAETFEAMIAKVSDNPPHLGEFIMISTNYGETEDGDESYRPNARRRLFDLDWQEDLTTLPLQLYEPIIFRMNQHEIPPEYISASIYQYAKKWIFSCNIGGETMSIYKRKSQRNVIETLERILPRGRELLPCKLLFEMLHYAINLEACSACRNAFEIRIGKQLDQAKLKDILISSQGYAKEVQYDIECIRRILRISMAITIALILLDLSLWQNS